MELKILKSRWSMDSDGLWVSLLCAKESSQSARRVVKEMEVSQKEYAAELKPYKPKRSLEANAYCWVLLDKLAEKTNIPKTEIYRNLIKEIGGNTETVCVQDKAAEKLCAGWLHNGIGWVTETVPSKISGCTNVILYYGSSTYDSGQMCRLIDLIVQECKQQDIETATDSELALLKEQWHEKTNKGA